MEMMEGFVRRLWKDVLNIDIPKLQVMSYRDAMENYGIDRPDTRYGLKILDISEFAAEDRLRRLQDRARKGQGPPPFQLQTRRRQVHPRPRRRADKLTRKITDGYTDFAKGFGAGGVAVVKVIKGEDGSPKLDTGIAKFLEPHQSRASCRRSAVRSGTRSSSSPTPTPSPPRPSASSARRSPATWTWFPSPGAEGGPWNFLWVIDFPMFEPQQGHRQVGAPCTTPSPRPRDDQMQAFLERRRRRRGHHRVDRLRGLRHRPQRLRRSPAARVRIHNQELQIQGLPASWE